MKEIKNTINNQTFLIDDPKKGDTLRPCMYVYKASIQFDGSLYKLNLKIVVRVDLQNKEMIGYTWDQTESMRTLKYSLAYYAKNFIGIFLQANVKHILFVKSDIRYG